MQFVLLTYLLDLLVYLLGVDVFTAGPATQEQLRIYIIPVLEFIQVDMLLQFGGRHPAEHMGEKFIVISRKPFGHKFASFGEADISTEPTGS